MLASNVWENLQEIHITALKKKKKKKKMKAHSSSFLKFFANT